MILLFLHLGLQLFQSEPFIEFFAAMFVVCSFVLTWRIVGVRK